MSLADGDEPSAFEDIPPYVFILTVSRMKPHKWPGRPTSLTSLRRLLCPPGARQSFNVYPISLFLSFSPFLSQSLSLALHLSHFLPLPLYFAPLSHTHSLSLSLSLSLAPPSPSFQLFVPVSATRCPYLTFCASWRLPCLPLAKLSYTNCSLLALWAASLCSSTLQRECGPRDKSRVSKTASGVCCSLGCA
jgi:hypothetical protein